MSQKIVNVLISHPAPPDENSPYHQLAREWGLEIDFHSFVHVEGLSTSEFRKQNINLLDFTAIIFTNKSAIDQFFRICKDLRIEMPVDTKYFCVSDSTAKYLQKYIVIRKRKLYVSDKKVEQLALLAKKHAKEKFLFPSGDTNRSEVIETFAMQNIHVKFGMVYKTVPNDLTEIMTKQYDMICFFAPISIEAVFNTFPEYYQGDVIVAVFGDLTAKAAEIAGLRTDIRVPSLEAPSMTTGIDLFLQRNKNKP